MSERSSTSFDVSGAGNDAKASLDPEVARFVALEAGFDDAGTVPLPYEKAHRDGARFEAWVKAGRAGTMQYLERADQSGSLLRAQVRTPFPWARSAIVCFTVYNAAPQRSIDPAPHDAGWIAKYAWSSRVDQSGKRRPSDYHKVLLKRLRKIESQLHERFGIFQSRAYVDTGPVVERALATAAGLGWTAKNTCLIHPKLGSFGFLAVFLTSLELGPQVGRLEAADRCGTCRRCIEACPTGALFSAYQMDATLCIGYLTIEHKGPIAPDLMEGMGRQVFGCDICQDVCPWNRKAPITSDSELAPRAELINPALDWLAEMDESAFSRTFDGSPVRRAGFAGFRRNVAIALGNSGEQRFAALLRAWAGAADAGLRTAAQWALKKINL